ncbi:proteasome regulatory particle base subunit rpn10, partial [Marasmius crinis-equi]
MSHLVTVSAGNTLISDVLISSPILAEDRSASIPAELGGTGGGGPSGSGSNAEQFEFGVDPSLDPELAMMPLEATMMIIDNSEYMRNGDYQPTRFDAQADAVNVVFQTKIDSNPENTVGVTSMAGKGYALEFMERRQGADAAAVVVGQGAEEKGMVKLAKKLKKNNVAVDVVCFGDGVGEVTREGEGEGKTVLGVLWRLRVVARIREFFFGSLVWAGANLGFCRHLVTVSAGNTLISDVLISSPILAEDRSASIPAELGGTGGGGGPSGSGSNVEQFEFGVDPSLDPELAM